jgi:adenylosuccinate synthase
MCMGGKAATITQPDYNAYNQQFELQKSAIDQSMNSGAQLMQQQLSQATTAQKEALAADLEQKKILAENTNAQAMRLATLIGTPPPEKSAQAPVVAGERGIQTKKGKSALRIGLASTSRMGQGSGLNIT